MSRWLLVALGLGIAVPTSSAVAMDMAEALSLAYTNNPTLLAQRAKVRAVDEDVARALSGWRPTVTVDASGGPVVRQSNTFSGASTTKDQHRDQRSAAVTARWPFFSGGRTTAQTSQAENAVLAEQARLESVEQTVLFNAATSYVNVVRDIAVVELTKNNEQVLGRQLGAVRDRFRVGEVTRTDVSQGESRQALSTSDRIQAEGNLQQSKTAFRNAVGILPENLAPAPIPADLPTSVDEAIGEATTRHPDVIAAQFDELASKDNIDAIAGELLPSLSLNGTMSRDLETSSENSRLNVISGLMTFTMPLYSSGSVEARLRQAKQLASQSRLKADQVRRDVRATATSAWEALQTARARIRSFQTQISAADIALEGVRGENTVGSRTVLDVLDAEQELLNAKVNLVRAQRDEVVAAFQLMAAVGRLDARSLNLMVDFYDPNAHYNEVRDKWFGYNASGQYVAPDPAAGGTAR
jgi:outer membrane protein